MNKTSKSTWVRAEQGLAAIFGALRRPLSGSANRDDIDSDDSLHPRLYLESKVRANSALWTLWRKTRAAAIRAKKVPVLGIREKHGKGCLLVIHEDHMREALICWVMARPEDERFDLEAEIWRAVNGEKIPSV